MQRERIETARWCGALSALLALVAPVAAQEAIESEATAQRRQVPTFAITRTFQPIAIDGALDEDAWADALHTTLDYEWFPGENVDPPVETEVFLTYDDDNLYIGFRAHDPDPSAVRAHLMDRDAINTFVQDDHVLVMIDTFDDERRAFQFRVNPLGVQADAIFSELDGIEDFSWDVLWESAGRVTDSGYEIEMAIPMNQLRFPSGDAVQTWGFDIGRSYPRGTRHRIANTPRPRDISCVLCRAAKIEGFENIEPGRNLVVTPTVTANRLDRRDGFPDGELTAGDEDYDPGLSVRWGVTANYTLNATLNPDFSQVEADVAQLGLNERFALFFPEKRPFFLEGIDFFSTLIDGVFTRTVADPDWGLKLTGKQGKNAIGVFATRDNLNNLLFPSNQGSDFTSLEDEIQGSVLRYRRDVGSGSTLGLLYAGREGDDYHNRVAGLDAFVRFSDTDTLSAQYLRSSTLYPAQTALEFGQPSDEFDDGALEILYSHQDRNWSWFARWRDFGPEFRADSGFEPRVDIRRAALVVNRNIWPGEDGRTWWNRQGIGFHGIRVEDHDGTLTDQNYSLNYEISLPKQSFFHVAAEVSDELFEGVLYEDRPSALVFFEIQPSRRVAFELVALGEETIDFANNQEADLLLLEPSVEVKLGRHLNLQLRHAFQRLDVAGGRLFEANLTQLRTVYQFNVRTFVRAIFQFRDIERNPALYLDEVQPDFEQLFTQLLFSYKLNAQTVLFVGYSENRLGSMDVDLTQSDRSFFVKLSYAWVV